MKRLYLVLIYISVISIDINKIFVFLSITHWTSDIFYFATNDCVNILSIICFTYGKQTIES